MDDILKAIAAPIGIFLYAILFQALHRRRAGSEAARRQKLRQKAYLLGRQLARWLRT